MGKCGDNYYPLDDINFTNRTENQWIQIDGLYKS